MSRTPTTTDTTVEWQERVTDPDSGSLTLSLVLDAVDDGTGFTSDGRDSSNISWLSFTKTESILNDGTLEALVDIVANKSGLDQGYTYRFKITADDGTTAVDRTFTLSIIGPPIYEGSRLYYYDEANIEITQANLSTNFDITTGGTNNDGVLDTSGQDNFNIYGGAMSQDGEKIFYGNGEFDGIQVWELSTPWDVTTASFLATRTNITMEKGCDFADGGTKLYTVSTPSDTIIREYTLSTPWDISTASLDGDFTETAFGNNVFDIHAREDGSMFFLATNGVEVVRYTMSTSYDVTSASQDQNVGFGGSTGHVFFQPDGSTLFIAPDTGDILQYSLSTSWDLTTAGSQTSITVFGTTAGVWLGTNPNA